MIRIWSLVVLGFVLVFSGAAPGYAANADSSSFSIAPPPIATPVFEAGSGDMKVRATYLTMESTDPATDFELSGYGFDFVGRRAFGNHLAMNFNMGVTYLDGDMGPESGLYGVTIPLGFNLEVQPFKSDAVNIILFGGPAFSISSMTMESTTTILSTTTTFSTSILSYVYGVTGGVQLGLMLGPVGIDAFVMTTTQSGTQETYSSSAYGSSDTSTTIPSFTTTTSGVDFVYLPWGLTLSSILQEAGKSDSNGTKTRMYQLAWNHTF